MTTVPDPPLPTGTPARMSSAENPRGLPPEQWGDRFRPRTWRTDPERSLMVLALLLNLVTLALGVGLYGHQPELVPIGWGDDGQPDRWAPRSWPLVLSIPATGLLATLGLWALAATRAPAPPRYPRTVDGMLRAHAVTACTRAAVGWVAVLTALTVAVLGGRAWTANTLPGLVSLTVLLLMIAALAMAWLETTQQNAMIDAELLARRLPVGPCLSAQHRIWRPPRPLRLALLHRRLDPRVLPLHPQHPRHAAVHAPRARHHRPGRRGGHASTFLGAKLPKECG